MGWDNVSELLSLTEILFIPHTIWVWRTTMGWYWQGKTEELGEKPVPVPLCPPQIPHGLTRAWIRTSVVKVRRLTAWAMARPQIYLLLIYITCQCPVPSTASSIEGSAIFQRIRNVRRDTISCYAYVQKPIKPVDRIKQNSRFPCRVI
jgi:hypothetical protein